MSETEASQQFEDGSSGNGDGGAVSPSDAPAGPTRRVAITGVMIDSSTDEPEEGPDDDAWDEDLQERQDWAWVEEWRASDEPPAWAPGVTLAVFTAVLVCLAILVLSKGLTDIPWLVVVANVMVAAGLVPALWLSRHLPVLRWISGGAALGVVLGWIGALIS